MENTAKMNILQNNLILKRIEYCENLHIHTQSFTKMELSGQRLNFIFILYTP